MSDADLRPMTLGELLDRTFSIYKRNFWLFVGIMFLPFLLVLVCNVAVAVWQQSNANISQIATAPGLVAGSILGAVVLGVVGYAMIGAAQAATIFAVSDLYLGRPATVRGSYQRVRGKIGRVLLVMFLASLLVGAGFVALIIPGIILLCRTSVAVPAAMLEDASGGAAVSRSMALTKGHVWQILGIFLLVWIFTATGAAIFQGPFAYLTAVSKTHTLPFGLIVLQQLLAVITQVLVGPIGTIAFSLMYYNLRVRKEAFDIQHLIDTMGSVPASGAASVA